MAADLETYIPQVAGALDTECGGGKLTHQSITNGHIIGTITARMFNALGARDVEEGALLPVMIGDATDLVATFPAVLVNTFGCDLSQKAEGIGYREEIATCIAQGTHPGHGNHVLQVNTFANKGHFDGEVSDPLRSKGGDTGNGGETLVTPYTLTFCDANGRRKDRPNGGLYVTEDPGTTPTLTSADAGVRVVETAFQAQDYKEGTYVEVTEAGPLTTPADRSRSAPVVTCYGIDEEQNAAEELMGCLKARTAGGGFEGAVAFAQNTRDEVREMAVVGALAAQPGMKQTSYIRQAMAVRRLTATECARLQGFPDYHARIPWRGKPAEECPDGPQYKCYGNSMATPVIHWLGKQIAKQLHP